MSVADNVAAIWTGLSRNLDAEGEAAIRNTSPFWKNHDQGAATVLVAALDPVLDGEFASPDSFTAATDDMKNQKAYCYMIVKCAMPHRMPRTLR
jgi:hypothetical protein